MLSHVCGLLALVVQSNLILTIPQVFIPARVFGDTSHVESVPFCVIHLAKRQGAFKAGACAGLKEVGKVYPVSYDVFIISAHDII